MHIANRAFWDLVGIRHASHFAEGTRVVEFGSLNVNGSIRESLHPKGAYTGLDWREGPDVDLVCFAKDYRPKEPLDAVVSASMLEHDPDWRDSIGNMVDCLSNDGILVLSWGAALNEPHYPETARDGKFHALPAGKVLRLLEKLGVHISMFVYETHFNGGPGEVCLIGFKDKNRVDSPPLIHELRPEDA